MRFWQISLVCLAVPLSAGMANQARGQDGPPQDKPATAKPLHPLTAQDLARREAISLYGLAMARQHEDRLVDALRLLEEARQLDPESAGIARALAPLYLALNRSEDGVSAGKKAVDLEPGDYQTWVLLGRQYKNTGRFEEAAGAFDRALACSSLDDRADLRAQFASVLGRLREDLGQFDQAIAAYLQVVNILDQPYQLLESTWLTKEEIAEQAADTYERMIRTCVAGKQFDRALEIYTKAEKKYPKVGPRLDLGLAKLALGRKQPELAMRYLDDYLRTQPQSLEAYEMRIDVLLQLSRQREIIPWLEQCLERDPLHRPLHLLLARQLARFGQAAKAEPEFVKLLEQQPDAETYRSLFQLYQAHRDMGGMAKVLRIFDEVMARSSDVEEKKRTDPMVASQAMGILTALRDDQDLAKGLISQSLESLREGVQLQSRTLGFVAALAARAKQLDEAEQFYRKCLGGRPSGSLTEQAAYQGLLEVLWQGKKYESVVEVCQQGIAQAKATHLLVLYHYSIMALLNISDFKKALEQCEVAVPMSASDERNYLDFRLLRVQALAMAEQFPAALSEGQGLLKEYAQPDYIRRIRSALSFVYSQMKDYTHYEEQLQSMLQADSSDATVCNNLGYLWADQNRNLEEAERLIRRAIELDREEKNRGQNLSVAANEASATFLDSLGWVLFRRGKLEEASKLLQQATSLSSGDERPVIWDHLGDVYSRMSQVEKAREAWKKSLQLYELGKRHEQDDQYKELKRKLQLVKKETSPS